MEITRPIDGVDLFIIYDVLEQEDLDKLIRHATAKIANTPLHRINYENLIRIGKWERHIIEEYTEKGFPSIIEEDAEYAMNVLREITKSIMVECYPDLDLVRFNDFGDISIRTVNNHPRMKPHVDGPPEIDRPDHGVKNLGSNYYLNDDYEGGELYYPNLDFSYKPKPNSLVIHRGLNQFRHGVAAVKDGVRLSFGMFAFEHYEEKMFTMEEGVDNDECEFIMRR